MKAPLAQSGQHGLAEASKENQRGGEGDGLQKSLPKGLHGGRRRKHKQPIVQQIASPMGSGQTFCYPSFRNSTLTMLEGCQSKEILQLAKCGGFGENKGNSHRDLAAHCCKAMRRPKPLMIKVPMQDCKLQKETTAHAAILLPHVLFSKLSENYVDSFENIFCIPECQAFWKGVQKVKDPRVAEPLAKSGAVQSPEKAVSIFIHGDGCEYRDSLMKWSSGSLLAKHPSLSAHLLIAAIPKSCTLATAWPALDAWRA